MPLFIAYLIKSCIEIFACHYLGHLLLEVPSDRTSRFWIRNSLFLFITVGQVYFVRNEWITLLVSLSMTYFLVNSYHGSQIKKGIMSGAILVISFSSEGLSLLILKTGFGFSAEQLMSNELSFSAAIVFMGILQLVLIALYVNFYKLYNKYRKNLYVVTAALIVSLTFIISYMLVTFAQTTYLPVAIVVILLLIASVFGCVGIFSEQLQAHQDQLRLHFLEQHVSNQVAHYSSLYHASMQVHALKHDLKNILINVQSYLRLQKYSELQSYIETFQEQIQPSALTDTGNPLIDAVLTAKQLEFNHIAYQTDIDPLRLEHVNAADIAMLVATALDNAIEGCADCKEPSILIEIHQNGKMVSIRFCNPTNRPLNCKENRLLTTKSNASEHGYGIRTIQHIAEKYQGDMTWDLTDSVFTLHVLLQDFSACPRP